VIRYHGEGLPRSPRVAVMSNDALGNYVVATPMLQMIRNQLEPAALDYYGGPRTRELWAIEPLLDGRESFVGLAPRSAAELPLGKPPYDLVVNIEDSAWARSFASMLCGDETLACGPCLGPDGRSDLPFEDNDRGRLWDDRQWVAADLTERYPFLSSGFIGAIFCRLAYLDGSVPGYRLPSAEPSVSTPQVLVATAASLVEKLWPVAKWKLVIDELAERGLTVGLLGAKPSEQRHFWKGDQAEEELLSVTPLVDLRGTLSLPEVVGAIRRAKLVVTIDNGVMHLAASTPTPTVALFRPGIDRLWTPPAANLRSVVAPAGLTVADIDADRVREAVCGAL
jgi:heptosyltransferase-3